MLNIENWIQNYAKEILDNFKERIVFIGLQGSYARGEATEKSDIDVVVIWDTLTIEDLIKYDSIISKMPYRELICGFLSGKNEITNWEKSDLFQFYYDTKVIYGDLDFILPQIKKENVKQAIWIGSCNLYHSCCHNIIHEKSFEVLQALYKQAVFVLQAKFFFDMDRYIKKKKDLLEQLNLEDKKILELYFQVKTMEEVEQEKFNYYSNELFVWAGELIKRYHI